MQAYVCVKCGANFSAPAPVLENQFRTLKCPRCHSTNVKPGDAEKAPKEGS